MIRVNNSLVNVLKFGILFSTQILIFDSKIIFFLETNSVDPDQTAPSG